MGRVVENEVAAGEEARGPDRPREHHDNRGVEPAEARPAVHEGQEEVSIPQLAIPEHDLNPHSTPTYRRVPEVVRPIVGDAVVSILCERIAERHQHRGHGDRARQDKGEGDVPVVGSGEAVLGSGPDESLQAA